MKGRLLSMPRQAGAALLVLMTALACAAEPRRDPAAVAQVTSGAPEMRHVTPVPDSVGAQPRRFEWTKVEAAEHYTLRIWNEVDVRIASEDGLTETSIDFPAEVELPAGTYFWAVIAMRGNRPIAETGLAAFVVQR